MKTRCILTVTFYCALLSSVVAQVDSIDYLGQTPPGNIPEIFAPDIISVAGTVERAFTISPSGDEIFFSRRSTNAPWYESQIYHMRKTDDQWSSPQLAQCIEEDYATEPFLSPDGNSLYFSSGKGKSNINDFSLWRSSKVNNVWTEPVMLFDIEASSVWEFHPSVTSTGTIYFCWWSPSAITGDIYKSIPDSTGYSQIIKLGDNINTSYRDTDPFIAPDESYLIYKSMRPGGYGSHDLYICYRREDGSWTDPVNLGSDINTSGKDDVGDISPDGKYMFFTKNDDIYWVDAGFIDDLNPEQADTIPDTTSNNNMSVTFEEKRINDEILVYPNPALNVLEIKINEEINQAIKYQMVDRSGHVCKQGTVETTTIDISDLTKGFYLMHFTVHKKLYSQKVLVH